MERIESLINEKYWWDEHIRMSLLWADMANEEGTNQIDVVSYLFNQIERKET